MSECEEPKSAWVRCRECKAHVVAAVDSQNRIGKIQCPQCGHMYLSLRVPKSVPPAAVEPALWAAYDVAYLSSKIERG